MWLLRTKDQPGCITQHAQQTDIHAFGRVRTRNPSKRAVDLRLRPRAHRNRVIATLFVSGFGGLEVACWHLVPKFAGSNPTEAVGFFRAKKILSTFSFGGEVKPSVPYHRFTACKRSLNVTWKSGIFRQNSSAISRPRNSTFGY